MHAGHRSIFDDRDWRIARAKGDVGQSLIRHQLIDRHARALRQNRKRRIAEHEEPRYRQARRGGHFEQSTIAS